MEKLGNPYLDYFRSLLKTQPKDMDRLLDPSLDDTRRDELLSLIDHAIVEKYGWAIPDNRAIQILQHYGPLVEMGAGKGYWSRLLQDRGVDIVSFDLHADEMEEPWVKVQSGTPEILTKFSDRTLLLCYPDDFTDSDDSMALECLNHYNGDTVIHIGEAFGNTICLSNEEGPWGRTSAPEFQVRLASVYHKVLQVPLPSLPFSMDTLSVWKRTKTCLMEDGIYAFIPKEERLDLTMASPSTAHLLQSSTSTAASPPRKKVKTVN